MAVAANSMRIKNTLTIISLARSFAVDLLYGIVLYMAVIMACNSRIVSLMGSIVDSDIIKGASARQIYLVIVYNAIALISIFSVSIVKGFTDTVLCSGNILSDRENSSGGAVRLTLALNTVSLLFLASGIRCTKITHLIIMTATTCIVSSVWTSVAEVYPVFAVAVYMCLYNILSLTVRIYIMHHSVSPEYAKQSVVYSKVFSTVFLRKIENVSSFLLDTRKYVEHFFR